MRKTKCLLLVSLSMLSAAFRADAASPPPAAVFKDCPDCPEMVFIPAGRFAMGGKPDQRLGFKPEPDELPAREVSVPAFTLGRYEITQAEWQALMGENPSDYISGDGRLPVETVSWNEAQEFARRLSRKTGKPYRLPTEAEWEYAARAGNDGLFSFGDDVNELGRYAWFGGNAGGHIHAVGLKEPNRWGLHDMHGNVWEWVEDCYRPNYKGAPIDGSAWRKRGHCQRNNRGGSWVNSALNLRSHHRHRMGAGSRGTFIGLRIARAPDNYSDFRANHPKDRGRAVASCTAASSRPLFPSAASLLVGAGATGAQPSHGNLQAHLAAFGSADHKSP